MSSLMEETLRFNDGFVSSGKYGSYAAEKLPRKKLAVVTCMDTRLTEILPAALNLKNGDAIVIKTAGAIISHPFGSVMRSLMVAVYDLGVEDIWVIGHRDCGMRGMEAEGILRKMADRGIGGPNIDFIRNCGVDIDKWLHGFAKVEDTVLDTVSAIKNHPLIPKDIAVRGFVMDPETGKLDTI